MMMNPELLNGAALAYMGDAVYEQFVRAYVLKSGKTHPNRLHRSAIKYVEAAGQAYAMQAWIAEDDLLSAEEIDMYRRGRNHKANTKAKNASIQDYRQATGFEALIGWLYLSQQEERLTVLMQDAIDRIEKRGQDEPKA